MFVVVLHFFFTSFFLTFGEDIFNYIYITNREMSIIDSLRNLLA